MNKHAKVPGATGQSVTRGSVVIRKVSGDCLEIWLPPVDHPEGEMICSFHKSYTKDIIAGLKAITEAIK